MSFKEKKGEKISIGLLKTHSLLLFIKYLFVKY